MKNKLIVTGFVINSIPASADTSITINDILRTIPSNQMVSSMVEVVFIPTNSPCTVNGIEMKISVLITHVLIDVSLANEFHFFDNYVISMFRDRGYDVVTLSASEIDTIPGEVWFAAGKTKGITHSLGEIDLLNVFSLLAQNKVTLSFIYTHNFGGVLLSKCSSNQALTIIKAVSANMAVTYINDRYTDHYLSSRSSRILYYLTNASRTKMFNTRYQLPLKLPAGEGFSYMKVNNMPLPPCFLPATNISEADGSMRIGRVDDKPFYLSRVDLSKHVVTLGMSGSGKTTFLNNLIRSLSAQNCHYLLLDMGATFRSVATHAKSLIYTVGSGVSPLETNPFNVEGFDDKRVRGMTATLLENLLDDDFKVMQLLIDKAFRTFKGASYNQFTEHALKIFDTDEYYAGENRHNLRSSLAVRLGELSLLDQGEFFHLERLLTFDSVIELVNLPQHQMALYVYYILLCVWLQKKYTYTSNMQQYPTVLILDEVHRILKPNKAQYAAHALIQLLNEILAEGRKYGLWLVLSDQTFEVLDHFYRQAGTKIVFRSPYNSSMQDYYKEVHSYIPKLGVGQALVCTSEMSEPCPVYLDKADPQQEDIITDENLRVYMAERDDTVTTAQEYTNMIKEKYLLKPGISISLKDIIVRCSIRDSVVADMKRIISRDPELRHIMEK